MFFKILFSYIIGYVNIQVEGFYIERFVNLCIAKRIILWGMDRKKSSILNTNISIRDFKKIKEIAKKTACKVKINQKKGLPFIFHKYKKRKIFFLLLILVFSILYFTSNFIWNIEIRGVEKIEPYDIQKLAESNGLKIGVNKSKIDTKKIINEIRLQRSDISWVGLKLEGTNAIIEIVEADKKPDIIDKNDFCNIISNKDGIITKINVQNGTSVVKVGDIVKNKDLLVEGRIQGKYTDPIYVHSSADIEAKVWYKENRKVYYHQTIEEITGKQETKYKIKINNFEINLYKTLSNFQNYDTINENIKLNLFSNFYLPIEIIKITNIEKESKEIVYGKKDLKDKTIKEIEENLKKEIEDKNNILNKYENIKEQEDYLDIEVVYEVLENIGTKEKIIF